VEVSVPPAVVNTPEAYPLPKLSAYGFFESPLASLRPRSRVLPYEPVTPLFTDYAHKKRFAWMPEGTGATVDAQGIFQFPEGTVLIKHFFYPADFSRPTENFDLVETRLLVLTSGHWQAYSYTWNADDSDAIYQPVGEILQANFIDEKGRSRTLDYAVPNKNQCKTCHQRGNQLLPLGPTVQNLDFESRSSGKGSQLVHWQEQGYLPRSFRRNPSHRPWANWQDPAAPLEDRALAYLQINCGHCHRENGSAHTTGLFLDGSSSDRRKLGICKPPVAAGKGAGNLAFDIQPGNAGASIILFRMQSTDPGVMMPELGRMVPHAEGIRLIRDWITAMPSECEAALLPL